MDQIVAALITAAASVVVAFISSKASQRARAHPQRASVSRNEGIPRTNARGWYVGLGVLLIWLGLSPALVHHDLSGNNYFFIPVVTAVLALAFPIPPLRAAWMSMAIYAVNYFAGPLSNRIAGSRYDTQFFIPSGKELTYLFVLGFGGAALAALICYLRLRGNALRPPETDATPTAVPMESDPSLDRSLPGQLSRLAAMRKDGSLTQEEFDAAKRKLLGTPLHPR